MTNVLVAIAHPLTDSQRSELLMQFDEIHLLRDVAPALFQTLSSNCPGSKKELRQLANDLHHIAYTYSAIVLPIGSPAFMWAFTSLVARRNAMDEAYMGGYQGAELERCPQKFQTLFAHSKKVSQDVPQEDGTIKKASVFEHQFFF